MTLIMRMPCSLLDGKPNETTPGWVGMFVMDTTSAAGEIYKCVAVNSGATSWRLVASSGGSIDDAVIADAIDDYLSRNPIEAPVTSVNGKTGEVKLTAAEVGALPNTTSIPAKTSDLTNDSGFITKAVSDLANYYTKSQTFSAEEINAKISAIPKFAISVVSALPTSNISTTTIYLVGGGSGSDLYTEYIYANGEWEILGSQRVDLTGYATESWVSAQLENCLEVTELTSAINEALAAAKASGEFDGEDGKDGADGVGIQSVQQTTTSNEDGGTNVITATLTSGAKTTFSVKNGKQGSAGTNGTSPTVAVSTITGGHRITITDVNGTKTVDVMDGADGSDGSDGRGIKTVARTSGTGAAGTTDTYTITYTDNTTSTFTVYNGTNGTNGKTPVKGTDYFTEADKEEIAQAASALVDTSGLVEKSKLTLGIHTDGLIYIFVNGVPVGNGVELPEGGDLVGYVDSENNIIVKGNLADGTYSVKYEMDSGKTIDIGDLVLDTNVYYSVTNNLTNCTTSNSATQVISGNSYSATITANSGYELSSVVVTMGGSPVSVSGGIISIASVTGNIVITAVAEESGPAYTNLLPLAVDASGNAFIGTNGEDGYKTGYRINSSGAEVAASDVECTGFMPYTDYYDTIYIKSISLAATETHNNLVFYDSSKACIKNLFISEAADAFVLDGDTWKISPSAQATLPGVAYFRFCAGSITDATIVTVNEEIV